MPQVYCSQDISVSRRGRGIIRKYVPAQENMMELRCCSRSSASLVLGELFKNHRVLIWSGTRPVYCWPISPPLFVGCGGRVLSIKKKNPFHTLRDSSLLKVRQITVFQRTDIEMPIRWAFSARSTKRTPIVPIKADQSLLWPSRKTDPIEQFVVVIHQTQAWFCTEHILNISSRPSVSKKLNSDVRDAFFVGFKGPPCKI